MYIEQYGDFWTYALNGRWLQKFCVGAAQLDHYGNANNSVIGADYHRPKVRLPGTAGLGDMGSIGKRLFFWNPNHNPRALVEKVDFVSCAGYLGGGDERAAARPQRRPRTRHHQPLGASTSTRVQANAAQVGAPRRDRRAGSGRHRLRTAAARRTQFPLSPVPTAEQVRLIRDVIDPDGMRKREFTQR